MQTELALTPKLLSLNAMERNCWNFICLCHRRSLLHALPRKSGRDPSDFRKSFVPCLKMKQSEKSGKIQIRTSSQKLTGSSQRGHFLRYHARHITWLEARGKAFPWIGSLSNYFGITKLFHHRTDRKKGKNQGKYAETWMKMRSPVIVARGCWISHFRLKSRLLIRHWRKNQLEKLFNEWENRWIKCLGQGHGGFEGIRINTESLKRGIPFCLEMKSLEIEKRGSMRRCGYPIQS